jgi:cell wall-associated NlpC family hydrolase
MGYSAGGGATDYLQWAINIAKDDSHGYSMASRTGHPDYDCSSLVFYALKACGYNVGSQPFYTGSMSGILQKAGFKRYPFRSKSELQPGDILLIHVEGGDQHTEIYAGDGKNVGAHWNYDGKPGDSGGNEISYGILNKLPVAFLL